jgi:hypothetical protein
MKLFRFLACRVCVWNICGRAWRPQTGRSISSYSRPVLRRLGSVIALTMRFDMRERPPAPVGSNPSQVDMRDWRRSERMLHWMGLGER